LTLLSIAFVVAAVVSVAETPPFEVDLPELPIELDLYDCRIDVELIDGVDPLLRVTTAPSGGVESPAFKVGEAGGLIRVARTDAGGTTAARATLGLVLDPAQALTIRGQGLAIFIRNSTVLATDALSQNPTVEGDNPGPTTTPAVHTFDLLDSEIFLVGAQATTITGKNTFVDGEDGHGELRVDIDRGSLFLRRHRGNLHLSSLNSASSIEELRGTVDISLDGGSLELRGGTGAVTGQVRSGNISLSRWSGNGRLTGEDATIELRDGFVNQMNVTATATILAVEGCRGSVTAQLTGGELTAEAVQGSLQATASASARVEVIDHKGPLVLEVHDDSSAEISEIEGSVNVNVDQSELRVDGASALGLTARGASLSLARVRRFTNFLAAASELELDLRDTVGGEFDLEVTDGSHATVYLASPCRVRLRDSTASSHQVDVTGCEFQMQNTGRWRGSKSKGLDGRPTFLLTARVFEGGSLSVRGEL